MKSGRHEFPRFLPVPDEALLQWLGARLAKLRTKKTPADIAKAAGTSEDTIKQIERGIIRTDVGEFRHIVRHGYKQKLEELLKECYQEKQGVRSPEKNRHFGRDYYYRIRLNGDATKGATPFLVGGDPDNFLWAIPLRRLNNQPLRVDLLELAPKRTRGRVEGQTEWRNHSGIEVIHVIHGSVRVKVACGDDDHPEPELRHGESIHLNSNFKHLITNVNATISAYLLVVRLPENQSEKNSGGKRRKS